MASKVSVWSGVPGKKVITIAHEGVSSDPGCLGCPAPCCRSLTPILSYEEVRSGKFKLDFAPFPPEGIGDGFTPPPNAVVATLAKKADGTCAHQLPDGRCGVWDHRPRSCAIYDCRKETRSSLLPFVQQRFHAELVK